MAESHGDAKGTTAHTAADGGHKAAFPPFEKDTFASQLVSLLIAFVALYLIVSRIALPRVEQAADARQRNSRHDQIERDECDQQRHQLRGKGTRLERRESSAVAAFGFGVGAGAMALRGAMTLSHELLLLLSRAPPEAAR